MGKQKIVLRVSMEDAKQRSKALKVTVGLPGIISAGLEGDKIVVVGEGMDSVNLTMVLRKKMGYADLVSVAAVEEKKGEKKEEKKVVSSGEAKSVQPIYPPYMTVVRQPYYESVPIPIQQDNYDPSCYIM